MVEEFPDEARYTAELASAYGTITSEPFLIKAIRLNQKLVADHPDNPGFRYFLAIACNNLGYFFFILAARRYEEAEGILREGLGTLSTAEGQVYPHAA